MASLIESLVESSLVRRDNARMSVSVRPPPLRLREVLEVFGALGPTASFAGLQRSMDLRTADPRTLANAVLGRWLTNEELAALAEDYSGRRHLRVMLMSQEFRGPFVRRIFEAFAEKARVLHVRIPSCAGRHVIALMQHGCSVVPDNVGTRAYANPEVFAQLLGTMFRRINTVRGLAISLPTLEPFLDPPQTRSTGPDNLSWELIRAPYRASDLLFAVLRSPQSLALSQVNGTLTQLRDSPDDPGVQAIRARIDALPRPGRTGEWKRLARNLLAESLPQNPICRALGDGTAEGALASCARVPIELVNLETYTEWARPAIDAAPLEPIGVSEPFLEPGDLTAQDHDLIATRMSEDIVFYDRFSKRLQATGLPLARGPEL